MNFLKNKLLTIVLVLCLVFTVFVGITANRKGNTGIFQQVVTSAVAPVQKYVYIAGQRLSNMVYFVSSIAETRKENIELKSKLEEMNLKLVDYEKFKKENVQLNDLLGYKDKNKDMQSVSASVIGKVGENWFKTIVIDAGKSSGVAEGQYVVNGQGLVGVVSEVRYSTAIVTTILDEQVNIPAKISSNADSGLVVGTGANNGNRLCKITYLPPDTKTKVKDLIVTSNIITDKNKTVKENIIIGIVTSVEEEKTNLIKAAYFKPVVDFEKLEKVLVIKK